MVVLQSFGKRGIVTAADTCDFAALPWLVLVCHVAMPLVIGTAAAFVLPDQSQNDNIDEVYSIVSTSAVRGQKSIPLHIVPFPLIDDNLALARSVWPDHVNFWTNELAPAYQAFEAADTKSVPNVIVDTTSGAPVYKLQQ